MTKARYSILTSPVQRGDATHSMRRGIAITITIYANTPQNVGAVRTKSVTARTMARAVTGKRLTAPVAIRPARGNRRQ